MESLFLAAARRLELLARCAIDARDAAPSLYICTSSSHQQPAVSLVGSDAVGAGVGDCDATARRRK